MPEAYNIPGTFVAQVRWEGNAWQNGVAHVSYQGRRAEIHILDFTGDLLGKEIEIRYLQQLRGLAKWKSIDDLIVQLQTDEREAREYFALESTD